jgi:hypothetical protein
MPVTIDADLPLDGDRERAWDDGPARQRLAERCAGEGDAIEPDCFGRAFIWRDPNADPTTRGAYSLPVADVIDGEPRIVFRAVAAAARSVSPEATPGEGRALQAPEGDLEEMRSAIARLYERFATEFDDVEVIAPWEMASAAPLTAGCSGGCDCKPQPIKPKPTVHHSPEVTMTDTVHVEAASRMLRASATGDLWSPPVEHFANPHLTEPTKITVTADGRVYGHLAPWNQPHIGYDGKMVYPPRNVGGAYEYFRQSKVVCADGTPLAVGLLTMNTGHADETLTARAAQAHYDHTGTIAAAVNIGEDEHGIWMAGSMLPDVSADQRNRFALARVSGDWRQPQPGSPLELIAALSVPNPGFPVRQNAELLASDRFTLAASGLVRAEGGQIRTLISAGTAVVDETQQAQLVEAVRSALNSGLIEELKVGLADAVRVEVARGLAEAKTPAPSSAGEAPVQEGTGASPQDSGAVADGQTDPPQDPAAAAPVPEPVPLAEAAAQVPPINPVQTPAPAPPVAAPPVSEAAQVAASALADRVRRHRASGARERLLAAAGLGKKA